mmetsp:Transcript_25277/g.76684  ORF Transcript_25277/g.76684 Transcript_25277/m.76684 type:complete len:255 (-) Transcript_25277:112-876(-)
MTLRVSSKIERSERSCSSLRRASFAAVVARKMGGENCATKGRDASSSPCAARTADAPRAFLRVAIASGLCAEGEATDRAGEGLTLAPTAAPANDTILDALSLASAFRTDATPPTLPRENALHTLHAPIRGLTGALASDSSSKSNGFFLVATPGTGVVPWAPCALAFRCVAKRLPPQVWTRPGTARTLAATVPMAAARSTTPTEEGSDGECQGHARRSQPGAEATASSCASKSKGSVGVAPPMQLVPVGAGSLMG